MIKKICNKIMDRIKVKMPDIDKEREEVIMYGLELMVGEVPKLILLVTIAWLLGILKYTIISFLIISPYRTFSGGLHLKTHIGCIIGTTLFFCGNVLLSQLITFPNIISKIIFCILAVIFAFIMITLYAPADTENVPILRKKERKAKKIGSYISVIGMAIASFFIKDKIISNMCIIGIVLQSIMICKFTYNIFKLKFGYLEYIKTEKDAV